MAYTYDQIIQAYTALHVGKAPDKATADSLQMTANLNASGQVSDAQVLNILMNGADSTTAVAVMSYQFFTGKSPTAAGLTYLVNSPINTSDLNDGYYAKFNIENRYINFAANLGLYGEGATAFANKYGAMDFNTYVASIYQTIIGRSYAEAASINVDAAIAYLISTKDAVLQTVREAGLVTANSSAAQIDLAVKAAMSGLVMAAAIKADVGLYAAATDNFMVALTQGNAVYNTDITVSYKPSYDTPAHGTGSAIDRAPTVLPNPVTTTPPVVATPLSFTATAGTDHFTGGALNDTFTVAGANYSTSDTYDGAGGNDTLTITGAGALTLGTFSNITNIETVNITNTTGITANLSAMTGVKTMSITAVGAANMTLVRTVPTDVTMTVTNQGGNQARLVYGHNQTVNLTGATTGTVQVSSAYQGSDINLGDVVVTRTTTGAVNAGQIEVTGGGTIKVNQIATNAANTTQTNGSVIVTGSVGATYIEVNNPTPVSGAGTAAIVGNNVYVADWGTFVSGGTSLGTLTTVKVDGFANNLQVDANNLRNLTLAHGSSDVNINNNGNLATGYATTLNATLNATAIGIFSDNLTSSQYTTLNIVTGATASSVASLQFDLVTALNISGASKLTISDFHNAPQLHTVTVTGSAGLSGDLSGASFTSVNASGTSGANTVTIDGQLASYSGGSGVDIVTLTNSIGRKAITLGDGNDFLDISAVGGYGGGASYNGGAGTADVLKLTAAHAAGGVGALTSNFERLEITGATNQTINLADFGAIDHVTTGGGNGLTLNNFGAGHTLTLNAAGTAYTIGTGGLGGTSDAISLQLTSGSGAGVAFATTGITATGIEIVNITTADTQSTPTGGFLDTVKWLDNNVKTITVSGNAGLNLTAASTALTTVDASGVTLGGFTWTAGALAGAATVKGSATGTNNLNLDLALGAVTYTGGSGVDQLAVNDQANVLNVGSGNDVVTVNYANAASNSVFTSIIGFGVGDSLLIGSQNGAAAPSANLGAAATGGTFAALLNNAASGDGSGTSIMSWFTLGTDTYIVLDSSNSNAFAPGIDIVVKLTGMTGINLTGHAIGGGGLLTI